jgi:Flp pilus assembly pilin Flp
VVPDGTAGARRPVHLLGGYRVGHDRELLAPVQNAAPRTPGAQTIQGGFDMRTLLARLGALAEQENGQTMAEYAIVLAVISVGVITALLVLGSNISDALDTVAVLV